MDEGNGGNGFLTRTERLLKLIQILRRGGSVPSGEELAQELSVSLRTLYRDIATLRAQGVPISGEAGVGYLLRPGFTLPPLMFSIEELEALLLGSRWVDAVADRRLAWAARNANAKIGGVLPPDVKREFETSNLWIADRTRTGHHDAVLQALRRAVRDRAKVVLDYRDESNRSSERVVWPVVIGFMESCQLVVGWCELRGAYRRFRIDRIVQCRREGTRYPRPREDLLREWQQESQVYPSHLEF